MELFQKSATRCLGASQRAYSTVLKVGFNGLVDAPERALGGEVPMEGIERVELFSKDGTVNYHGALSRHAYYFEGIPGADYDLVFYLSEGSARVTTPVNIGKAEKVYQINVAP